jgi:hypothetical protein
MTRSSDPRRGLVRCLGLAASVVLMLVVAPHRPAAAMSLITPQALPQADAASEGLITEVRGGHGGGHGGGFHGGGFHGGGGHAFHGGGGFHGGGFRAAPAFHGGGFHHGGFHHGGGFRFAHHHRHFYGGYYPAYYPSYYYYPRRCRIIYTHYGPRRVCHRWHRHHHRRYYY